MPRWPIIVRKVSGHSMMPVLPPGTYVAGSTHFKQLKVGDIVIFSHDGKEKIKRIDRIQNSDIYVLGDHAEASKDSRQFGWIPKESVIARVFWPHAPKDRAES